MRPQKQHNPLRLQVDANNYVRAVRPLPQKGLGSSFRPRPVRRPGRRLWVQLTCFAALAVCSRIMFGLWAAVAGHWVAFAAGIATVVFLLVIALLVIVAIINGGLNGE